MHFYKLLCPFLISHIILIIAEVYIYKTIKIYISDIYNKMSIITIQFSHMSDILQCIKYLILGSHR